jgi:hypothetical protein
MTVATYIRDCFLQSIPQPPEKSVCEWGKKHVRLIGSARSEAFDPDITPWIKVPLECTDDGVTLRDTFVKPIQAGGSVAGEVAICRRIARGIGGDIQYNWETDEKADERWKKRIEKILKACKPVLRVWPSDRAKASVGLVNFPHVNFTMQGAFTRKNLSSDSIAFQVNEEIHNWKAGHLAMAYGRTTAFWNPFIFNISNAGYKGDQLHEAFMAGTQEHWQVWCPGCREFHAMRTRWSDKEPHLGGLRYDSTQAKRGRHDYDYNKLQSTVRFQMPCGYLVYEDPAARRALSLSGDYSAPQNSGAHISNRSFTLEAVSVDYIPFMLLIQEKHAALRALDYGDPEPWQRYLRERECKFWDPEDRPLLGSIVIRSDLKKDRAGLQGRANRFFSLDRQQGDRSKGEFPHWWLVIRDVMENADSQLVFEGKMITDHDVLDALDRHECVRHHGVADSGDDTTFVYTFCLRHGINCIKGDRQQFFAHDGGTKRIFSPEKPLHTMIGAPPKYDYVKGDDGEYHPDPREPMFWMYSKHGIRERLYYIRTSTEIKWDVPGDASDDYQLHMESEVLEKVQLPDGSYAHQYRQVRERNDLYVCECYCAMLMDMAGYIGSGVPIQKQIEK